MKCPNCRYVSHDYLDSCRKCSADLVAFKRKFNLMVLRPGDLNLGTLVDVDREDVVGRDRLRLSAATSDTPPSKSYIGLDELTEETEIDIQFDPDTSKTSTEPGELTKTFYVPEVLAKHVSDVNLPDRAARLDELPATPEVELPFDPDTLEPLATQATDGSAAASDGPVPLANPGSAVQYVQHPPVDTTDMSVGHLDNCLDEFEDIQLDTSEIDHDINLLSLPSTAEITPVFDDDAARREIEEITPDISSTSVADETPEPMLSMAQEEPLETAAPFDNRADDALGLKLEVTGDVPSPAEEGHTGTERAE